MKLWNSLDELQSDIAELKTPLAISIGNFDGIHWGHQALIHKTVDFAGQRNGSAIVVTFNPHPQALLSPEKGHSRIFSLKDQQVQLEKLGVRGLFRQSFSREFSQLSPQDFVEKFIVNYFHPAMVCVGEDFRFGAFRAGSGVLLEELGKKFGFLTSILPPVRLSEEVVSTSKIKKYLQNGDLLRAKEFLGRYYAIQGLVEAGEGRGRQLGFPTANVNPDVEFAPRQGVYVCQVHIKAELRPIRAVMNIGINKTFVTGDAPLKFEVHLLDWNKNLYGQNLKVELMQFIRPEKKFSNIEELRKQIQEDILEARKFSD